MAKRRSHKQVIKDRAEEIGRKYREKVEKAKEKAEMNTSAIVPLVNHSENRDDSKKYEFTEFIGTEEECVAFMKTNNYDWIGTAPYLYQGTNFRITYWKEV